MPSDIFAGNQNNVARSISKIWAGSENNIAMPVKGVFIGDSNNTAIKVWPNSILPSNYQQLEWIEFRRGNAVAAGDGVGLNTYFADYYKPPLLRINFSITNVSPYKVGICSIARRGQHRSYEVSILQYNQCFHFLYGRQYWSESQGYYYRYPIDVQSNNNEGVLINTSYTISYCELSQYSTGVHLYNTEGYYSINSNTSIFSSNMPYTNDGYDNEYLYLFATYRGEGDVYFNPPNMKVYSCQLYDQGENMQMYRRLARDYYPARRKSDNAIGMYDMIERIFSPINVGSNTDWVIAGPSV